MITRHPWQTGPTELIEYAIDHLNREADFDQRIAFLLLDIGVETLFKTFLQLPEEVTGTELSYTKRNEASEGKFHELTRGVKQAAGHRLDGIDLTHIQFYHDLRNKLYHQGNGITVPADKAKGYAAIAVDCLKRLLDVDLEPSLHAQDEIEQSRAKEQAEINEFEQVRKKLRARMEELRQVLLLAVEGVEPSIVLPSFEKQLEDWREQASAQFMAWSTKSVWEAKLANTSLDEEDTEVDNQQYASFLKQIKPTMPRVLGEFVNKYHVTAESVISIIRRDHFEEVLLIFADIALRLPTDPSDNIYWEAELISRPGPIGAVVPLLGDSIDEPVPELTKLANQLCTRLHEVKEALVSRTLSSKPTV